MNGERELPNLDDPLVRKMADRNHVPAEMWSMGGGLLSLCCDECKQAWPCRTRRALARRGEQDARKPPADTSWIEMEHG